MSNMPDHRQPSPFDAVLIAGPTASGKSALALALARQIGGAVVNADSMQVYRDLRILSARPSAADEAAVPHLLYGHVAATDPYSVGRFQADAAKALAQAQARGLIPIFTGGTGLYFGALTDGLAEIPAVPAEVRQAAREKLERIGVAALHAELACRDPETAQGLRPTDPQRTLRAWEVLEATGKPLIEWQRTPGTPVLAGLRLVKFVLDIPREELRARIHQRFLAMLATGATAEAAALRGLDPMLPAAKTLGLRALWALAEGALTEAEAVTAAVTATRQFAKRQMTWFRHRMEDYNFISHRDFDDIAKMRQYLS
jgi:tRNA dimethylallyltransferase